MVTHLLAAGHKVTVYDVMYFGNGHLPDNDSCTLIRADIRDKDKFRAACEGQDAVIYLAGITNNTMCERAQELHQAVNIIAFEPCVRIAKQEGVKRFIFASSVAVYGSSDDDATEDSPIEPTTLYASAKAICEELLWGFQSRDFATTVIRSASIVGYATHQRLDTTINMMTHHASRLHLIKVAGGAQKRSHISIKDITRLYSRLLDLPAERIAGQTFNAVTENQRVKESAMLVARVIGHTAIALGPRTDDRSYSVDGSHARSVLDFEPKHSIEEAIRDMKTRFVAGYWPDSLTNEAYLNLMPA